MNFDVNGVPDEARVDADAQRVFEVVRDGGVALIHLDVAYALVARAPQAVHGVYAAKGRDYAKPMGLVGGTAAHEALHVLDADRRAMVRAITQEHDWPLSVVAPFVSTHPYVAQLDPWVLRQSTHSGTLNLLLNAGALRTRLAELCWTAGVAMVGTSANVSLAGAKFRVAEVEPEILRACDVVIDYGVSRHHNNLGRSSTIIDFANLRLVRLGVCGEAILELLQRRFGVTLG